MGRREPRQNPRLLLGVHLASEGPLALHVGSRRMTALQTEDAILALVFASVTAACTMPDADRESVLASDAGPDAPMAEQGPDAPCDAPGVSSEPDVVVTNRGAVRGVRSGDIHAFKG